MLVQARKMILEIAGTDDHSSEELVKRMFSLVRAGRGSPGWPATPCVVLGTADVQQAGGNGSCSVQHERTR